MHSSNILVSLWAMWFSLSEYFRSEVVSLMRSLGYPLLINQEVSFRALAAYISGEEDLLMVLMNSPLTTPVLMLRWCAEEKCR